MRHLLLLLSGVFVASVMAACGGSMTPTPLVPTQSIYTTMPSDAEMLSEKILGNPGAPNTIYEYVSFWCPGCKNFHATVLPQLKAQFVDTGKANIVFRNLFLSGETPNAALLARCAGNAKFFELADRVFTTQGTWGGASDPDKALAGIMLGFGMSQSLIDACVTNATVANGLFAVHNAARGEIFTLPDGSTSLGFTHVPAIVINGVKLDSTVRADGTANPDNDPTLANITKYIK